MRGIVLLYGLSVDKFSHITQVPSLPLPKIVVLSHCYYNEDFASHAQGNLYIKVYTKIKPFASLNKFSYTGA